MKINKKDILFIVFIVCAIVSCIIIYKEASANDSNSDNSNSQKIQNVAINNNGSTNQKPVVIDNRTNSTSNNKENKADTHQETSSDDLPKASIDKSQAEIKNNLDTNQGDSNSKDFITYNLLKDDSAESIYKKFSKGCPEDIFIKSILKNNNLSSAEELHFGMSIKIPNVYLNSGDSYTVKSGDSLYVIAKKYYSQNLNEGIKKIKNCNFLNNDILVVGKEIFIPVDGGNGKGTLVTNADIQSKSSKPLETISYTVSKNDTLMSICKKYNSTCPYSAASRIILTLNNLSSNKDIKPGIKIFIPEKYLTSGYSYTVKQGDTLYKLVNTIYKNNLSDKLKELVQDNNISNGKIQVGSKLFIPQG